MLIWELLGHKDVRTMIYTHILNRRVREGTARSMALSRELLTLIYISGVAATAPIPLFD
jgi:hypothetical protein